MHGQTKIKLAEGTLHTTCYNIKRFRILNTNYIYFYIFPWFSK